MESEKVREYGGVRGRGEKGDSEETAFLSDREGEAEREKGCVYQFEGCRRVKNRKKDILLLFPKMMM